MLGNHIGQHESLSYYHVNLITGRALNLPPLELSHRDVKYWEVASISWSSFPTTTKTQSEVEHRTVPAIFLFKVQSLIRRGSDSIIPSAVIEQYGYKYSTTYKTDYTRLCLTTTTIITKHWSTWAFVSHNMNSVTRGMLCQPQLELNHREVHVSKCPISDTDSVTERMLANACHMFETVFHATVMIAAQHSDLVKDDLISTSTALWLYCSIDSIIPAAITWQYENQIQHILFDVYCHCLHPSLCPSICMN